MSEKGEKKNVHRKFMLELLELYRELPALWKVKSKDYSNRNKKADSYNVLLGKYRERFPTATLEELKKKLNSLRTNFRSELRKIEHSAKSGVGKDDLYESKAWYMDGLMFLKDQEVTTLPRSAIYDRDLGEDTQANDSLEWDEVAVWTQPETTPLPRPGRKLSRCIASRNSSPTSSPRDQKMRRVEAEKEELISLTTGRLVQGFYEDEHDIQGKTWAHELRKMDPEQQMYAKKAINDVLFEGCCGNLGTEIRFRSTAVICLRQARPVSHRASVVKAYPRRLERRLSV